jgi:hypothetical protein
MNVVKVTGQYATLSRGRISAKHLASGVWAGKNGGGAVVYLDRPGKWMVSQSDGFSRKETVYITISDDGSVSGLGRRMEIVA